MRQIFVKSISLGLVIALGLILLPPTPQPANAQFAWGATLWVADGNGSFLETINPLGSVATVPLSPNLVPPIEFNSFEVMTSDNDQYILHYGYDPNSSEPHLTFGATGDGPCCWNVSDIVTGAMAYEIAGFQPNGSLFAFSYVKAAEGTNAPFVGGIMVIDAATGLVANDVEMESIGSELNLFNGATWAYMGDWTEDGILFTGNCYGCEGVFEGEFSLWERTSQTFIENSGVWFSSFGTGLDLTGEFLRADQDTRYPYDPSPGMFLVPNVVKYYPNGDFSGNGTVVYVDGDAMDVGRLHWVGDGQAFIVEHFDGTYWDVVHRDGRVERVSFAVDSEMQFLGGTPDGWLAVAMNSDRTRTVYHYDISSLAPSVVTTLAANVINVQLANSPELGASVEALSFAAAPPPIAGDGTAHCPNFLPSRLVVGQQGRVTPGAANRMREFPSLDSAVVGQIPGSAQFSVLEGPICDEVNQIAWWRVNYNGTEGWTAEGQADTYWTEPVG